MQRRDRQPRLEFLTLEDRSVPTALGLPWPDGQNLTLSFAQTGASVGGQPNSLTNLLNRNMSEAQWRGEILRAFQTWAVNADINIGLVTDDGAAFGTDGLGQKAVNRGDIRVGAAQLGADQLALGNPYEAFGGWSGEVVFNTLYSFGLSGTGNTVDLFSVALHEAGHTLGLGNSPDPASAMYTVLESNRKALTGGDVAAIQGLYGPRSDDPFDRAGLGNDIWTGAELKYVDSSSDYRRVGDYDQHVARGDIKSHGDADWYRVRMPAGQSALRVSLKTSGISLLAARVSAYDSAGRLLATQAAADPTNGDVEFEIPNLPSNQDYYIKVESGRADVFGIGSYRLAVGGAFASGAVQQPPESVEWKDAGGRAIDESSEAQPSFLVNPAGEPVRAVGNLSSAADVDSYLVTVPPRPRRQMVVTAWGKPGGARPAVEVFDAVGRRVDAAILGGDSQGVSLEVGDVAAGAAYFIRVTGQSGSPAGEYRLSVQFPEVRAELAGLVTGSLSLAANRRDATAQLAVSATQVYQFELLTQGLTGSAKVSLMISDEAGRLIAQMDARAGRVARATALLRPGVYKLRFWAVGTQAEVAYLLRGDLVTDPLSPRPINPGTTPQTNPRNPADGWVDVGTGGSTSVRPGSNQAAAQTLAATQLQAFTAQVRTASGAQAQNLFS